MTFDETVNSIVERSRTSNDAAAGMRQVEAAIKAEYDPAKRRELETTQRAYEIAAMRLLQSAALDKAAVYGRDGLVRCQLYPPTTTAALARHPACLERPAPPPRGQYVRGRRGFLKKTHYDRN